MYQSKCLFVFFKSLPKLLISVAPIHPCNTKKKETKKVCPGHRQPDDLVDPKHGPIGRQLNGLRMCHQQRHLKKKEERKRSRIKRRRDKPFEIILFFVVLDQIYKHVHNCRYQIKETKIIKNKAKIKNKCRV